MMHDTRAWPELNFAEDPDDNSGLAAWVEDDGRFFAVGGDGIAREYGDGPDEEARLHDDMRRTLPIHVLSAIAPAGRSRPSHGDDERSDYAAAADTLAAEWRRTALLAAAGLPIGVAIAAVLDWLTGGPGLGVMVGW